MADEMRRPGRVEDPDACMRPKGCATTISLAQPQNQDISSAPVAYSGHDYWFMSGLALVWLQRSIDERDKHVSAKAGGDIIGSRDSTQHTKGVRLLLTTSFKNL